jgi:putative flippase GtrA
MTTSKPSFQMPAWFSFGGYSLSGMTGFGIDFALLYWMVEYLQMHYVFAVAIGYAVGVTIHFLGCRFAVFRHTKEPLRVSYGTFVCVALAGILGVIAIVTVLVEIFGVPYGFARVLAAGLVGIVSFVIHQKVTFKVK